MIDDYDELSDDEMSALVDDVTAEPGTADTAAPAPADSGKMSALGRVKALAGDSVSRLKFADGVLNSNKAAQLSSVLDESEPGTALELVRQNTPFNYDNKRASLVLVLPTSGSFDGLHSRSAGEAKGSIIHDLKADAINAIVTEQLLADDAFALIPNAVSLERMAEYELLTKARYRWAIVTDNVATGGLEIFAVPATSPEGMVNGPEFEQVQAISAGSAAASDFVDPAVISAMLEVYRTGPSAEAGDRINNLVNRLFEVITTGMLADHYPSTQEMLDVIAGKAISAQAGRHRSSSPSPASQDDLGFDDPFAEDDAVVADTEDPFVDDEPSFIDEGQDEVVPVAATPPPAKQRRTTTTVDADSVATAVAAALEGPLSEVTSRLDKLGGGTAAVMAPVSREQVEAEIAEGADFSHAEVMRSAHRRYINEDLGLYIDSAPFLQRLTGQAPEIVMPSITATPWLTDQVTVMVASMNAELATRHRKNSETLFSTYMAMADQIVLATTTKYDPRRSPDSAWGRMWAGLEAERKGLDESSNAARNAAEDKIAAVWEARKAQHISDASARAGLDFDNRNAARRAAEIREAGDRVRLANEAIVDSNLVGFNEQRRAAARNEMDDSMAGLLANLGQSYVDMLAEEQSSVALMTARISDYIDEHRREDVELSEQARKDLAADHRYEDLVSRTQADLAQLQSQHDQSVASIMADFARERQSHNEQMRLTAGTNELEVTSLNKQIESLSMQMGDMRSRHEASLAGLTEESQREVARYAFHAKEAERNRDDTLAASKRNNTLVWATMAVLVVVAGVLGFLLGAM